MHGRAIDVGISVVKWERNTFGRKALVESFSDVAQKVYRRAHIFQILKIEFLVGWRINLAQET